MIIFASLSKYILVFIDSFVKETRDDFAQLKK